MIPEPIMEAVAVPGTISGEAIIDDLCGRIAQQLSRDCNLRSSDCYAGYSATATVAIQLHDVYPVDVAAEVAVGAFDPHLPTTRITVGSEVAGEEADSSLLERPIDPAGFTPPKRIYVSRIRAAK
jgi:hypothetical protein